MNLAWRLQDLPPDDLEVLLRRRPEATELLAAGELSWTKLAAQLSRPVHVSAAFDALNLFLRQVVELAVFMGGRLTLNAAGAEGLEPADLAAATRELGRWGLAFEAADGALELVPELRRLIFDPGLGFGKTTDHNFLLLRHMNSFLEMGPLLIAPSRKRFLDDRDHPKAPEDRDIPTAAVMAWSTLHGASLFRTHRPDIAVQIRRVLRSIAGEDHA